MKRISQAHLPVIALTHPGMKGKNNEDRYAVSAFEMNTRKPTPVLLALVCDGIGGHRAGEVAAEMAVNQISQRVAESDGSAPAQTIEDAVVVASQEIYTASQTNSDQHGMGATLACAWILGRRLYTATIGDSRIYLLRNKQIRQLSIDHTWIQDAISGGLITREQIKGHPNAHVIRRYLGSATPPKVDFRIHLTGSENDAQAEANQGMLLLPGDILILCTDGLSDLVDGPEIQAAYLEEPIDGAAQKLVDLANARGGHDNITLISIGIPERSAPRSSAVPGLSRRLLAVGCAVLVFLALLVFGLGAGWVWLTNKATATVPPNPVITQSLPLFDPSATLHELQSPAVPSRIPSLTPTIPLLPADDGPTFTPWPTSSVTSSETPTMTLTLSATVTPTLPGVK